MSRQFRIETPADNVWTAWCWPPTGHLLQDQVVGICLIFAQHQHFVPEEINMIMMPSQRLNCTYFENTNAVHVDFHIVGWLCFHSDNASSVRFFDETWCGVFARNFWSLVKKVRSANLLVMSNKTLNLDGLSRVSAQLNHWIAMTTLVLDGTPASFSEIASSYK